MVKRIIFLRKFTKRYYAEYVYRLRLSKCKFLIAFDDSFWHGSVTSFFKMKNRIFDEICVWHNFRSTNFQLRMLFSCSKICIISHVTLTVIKASSFSYLYVVWLDFILSCRGLIILHWSDYFVFSYFSRIVLSNQFMKECNK